jgi:hypothetical protein
LQVRVLEVLAELDPPWTFTDDAALAGFHVGHRLTRDLDLFVHGSSRLGDYGARASALRELAGMQVTSLQSGPAFHRLLVTLGEDTTTVDGVADPVAAVELPIRVHLGEREIQIDPPHEILVNKLCALIQRSELRDLQDIRELTIRGGDLRRALEDAPRKDSGFSALTLGWVLRELPLAAAARAEGWPQARVDQLEEFRVELIDELSRWTRPADE